MPASMGDRIELVRLNDEFTLLKPGDRGTVTFVDDLGTVHADWDNGAKLGLVKKGGDRYRMLTQDEVVTEKIEAIERSVEEAAADSGLDEDEVAHDVIINQSDFELEPIKREIRRRMLGWTEQDHDRENMGLDEYLAACATSTWEDDVS
jgi:hypothetical protein